MTGELIEKINDNIYRIRLRGNGKNTFVNATNNYLIKGDRSILIDTCADTAENRKLYLSILKELGEEPGSFDIAITHLHFDHAQISYALLAPEAKLYCNGGCDADTLCEKSERIVTEQRRLLPYLPIDGMNMEHFTYLEDLSGLHEKPLLPEHLRSCYTPIQSGTILKNDRVKLQVIEIPGHCDDHVAFYDEENGYLFPGDLVLSDVNPAIEDNMLGQNHLGEYLNSLDLLSRLPVKLVMSGHGDILTQEEFRERCREIRESHEKKLKSTEEAIRNGAGSLPEIVASIYQDIPEKLSIETMTKGILIYGDLLAHVNWLIQNNRIICRDDRFYPCP